MALTNTAGGEPELIPEATPWLTVPQAAARAQVGRKVIYTAIAKGKLKAARLGVRRELRIHREWLDAWIEAAVEIINPTAPGPLPFRK
jgi:excisionase family DNA binding protein